MKISIYLEFVSFGKPCLIDFDCSSSNCQNSVCGEKQKLSFYKESTISI